MNTHRAPLLCVSVPLSDDPNRVVSLTAVRVFYERKYWFVVRRLAHPASPMLPGAISSGISLTIKSLIILVSRLGLEPRTP